MLIHRPLFTALRRTPAVFLSITLLFMLTACDVQTHSTASSSDPTGTGSTSNTAPTTPPPSGATTTKSSVTLNWSAPSQNVDGSPLTDLAGYRVYYSPAPWGWTDVLDVHDPAATSVVVPDLSTGTTWYFSLTTYNASGVESTRTGWVSKML